MIFWTEKRHTQLADLLAQGFSAGQIGGILGCSRNAVIGRVQRSGDLTFNSVRRKSVKASMPAAPRSAKPVVESYTEMEPAAFDAAARHASLLEVKLHGECKFPVNKARPGEPHLFCGLPTEGGSWCAHHRARVFGGGTQSERRATRELERTAG